MKKHLTTDELIEGLYEAGELGHLNECDECSAKFRELGDRRALAVEPVPMSYEFLAAQRRNVYARMGERPPARANWLPALAAAVCLLVVGLVVNHPAQAPKPEVADTQLFSDVYSIEQNMEPIAAQPIDALFDQDQP